MSTVLVKKFAGVTIINKTGENANIRLTGGLIRAENDTRTGKHVAFRDVIALGIENVRFGAVFNDWNTSIIDCEDVIVRGVVMAGGTDIYTDGLHFAGGKRITVSDCNIDCGDDALSLLNETITIDPVKKPLEDVVVTNCYLYSRLASAIKIQVDADNEAIRRVRISNIVAKTGGPTVSGNSVIIRGPAARSDLLADVEIDGVVLDASQNGGYPAHILNCQRITLTNFAARQPYSPLQVTDAERISLINCTIDAPRDPNGTHCLKVDNSYTVRIVGGLYKHARNHAIWFSTVERFEISDVMVEAAAAGPLRTLDGIRLDSATNGIVSCNHVSQCIQWGIRELGASDNNYYVGNRLPFNSGGGLRMVGLNSQAARNVVHPGNVVDDSGGFRQTIDGWMQGMGLSGLAAVEISRNNFAVINAGAGRFRPLRSGSITGVGIYSDVLQTAGELKAEVYINTGGAGAAGSPTGLIAKLDGGNRLKHSMPVPAGTYLFAAGDELYIALTTTTSPAWAPTGAKIRCSIEIED